MRFLQRFKSAPRVVQGILLGIFCAALASGLAIMGWLNGTERGTMDSLFRARGFRYPSPHIVILVADDPTVARAGRWPLPWNAHAEVVRRLHRAGARAIAFDFLFSTPSPNPQHDAQFIRACREAGNVVQAMAFHVPSAVSPSLPVSWPGDRHLLPERFHISSPDAQLRSAAWVTSALPALQSAAPAMGHINIYPEADGALRRIPHLIRYRDQVYPSLALAAASHFLGLKPTQVMARNGEISFSAAHDASEADGSKLFSTQFPVPFDRNGEAWVNWAGGNRTFPTYSYNEFLDGLVAPEVFKNRIVLVGTTAAGTFEHRPTPFSPVQPAIELQANAVDDILSNRPLREIGGWGKAFLLLGFASLVGMVTAPRRALGGTLWIIGLLAVLWQGAALCMSYGNLYIPIAAPLLAGVLTYVLMTALNYRWEWEANWRADESVTALARGSALMSSVRDRKRLLGVIHNTAREALGAEQVFIVIGDEPKNEALREVARRIAFSKNVLLWPAADRTQSMSQHPLSRHLHRIRGVSPQRQTPGNIIPPELLRDFCASLGMSSKASPSACAIIGAPLPGVEIDVPQRSENPAAPGAIIAVGRSDGRFFGERDAAFLQTLAKQAALALEHLEYYEMLHSKVEWANRDLREAYSLLADQSVKLSAAVESIDNALIVSDETGRAIFVNTASQRILGAASPALGELVGDALRRGGQHQLCAMFEELDEISLDKESESALFEHGLTEHGSLVRDIECEAPRDKTDGDSHTDAARRILAAHLTPLLRGDGIPLGKMIVVADVTVERELDTMKSDFVSYVAHELRTPLTTILGYASLLQEDSGSYSPDMRGEMANSIVRHCRRLNRMISELLDVSRLEAGRELSLRPENLDLAALCESALNGVRPTLSDPESMQLQFECEHRPLLIRADPDRLEQIVSNLLSNAVKYSPDGGTVTMRLIDGENEVQMQVQDTGMGMTPDQQTQLFQKFYRTPDAQARGIKGTGLGLFLVKQLIEAHDGKIEVRSAENVGTTFIVTLPKTNG